MYKNLPITLLMLLVICFIFTSAEATDEPSSSNSNQSAEIADNNESTGTNIWTTGYSRGIRQVYGNETTQRDRQQYYSPGRQIVYAGYYNPSCDYVYMVWSLRTEVGATTITQARFGIFDWILNNWDFSGGGSAPMGPYNALGTNVDVSPHEGHMIGVSQHAYDASSPWYTVADYLYTGYCPEYYFTFDSCPGPPNYEYIQTGSYCTDDNPSYSPYIWPRIDIDIDYADDFAYVHVAAAEDTCDGSEEVASLVYYRKETDNEDETWTGTWEGPYFMDSSYVRAAIVRSDKDRYYTSVYYAYLKPIYYENGSPHPCASFGFEHYYVTNEVVYQYSPDEGWNWSGPIYITDYASQFESNGTEPACYDLSALVDPNGIFHIVWATANRDPDDYCSYSSASKLWHWSNWDNCISLAYDASHPGNFTGDIGKWNLAVAKPNISWCDEKLYISFTRFGAHPSGDWSYDAGLGDGSNRYENGDIMVVASDSWNGDYGVLWTSGVNLTDTESPDCSAGDCYSEHWPTMAMYSTDSLMIEYIEDKDPGAWEDDPGSGKFDNPVMFLTYPCFAMSDVPANAVYVLDPDPPIWENIPMAPYGDEVNCPTPAIVNGEVTIENRGNIDLYYTTYSDAFWLSIQTNLTGVIEPGAGPKGSDDPSWDGMPTCGSNASITIEWQAESFALAEGTYEGTILIDFAQSEAQDTAIHVSLNVVCTNYQPPAEYVRDEILGGSLSGTNLWMTPGPLDNTHVVRNIDPTQPDIPFPYESGWLVMIDDHPDAYWGHPCRWVFVNEDFSDHTTPLEMDFFPTVFGDYGSGDEVTFECVDLTSLGAEDCSEPIAIPKFDPITPKADNDCLYAVLISGGWNAKDNIEPFKTDLKKIYNILRTCGYPANQIFVYYGNNMELDLDGQAGSEVTGSATEANIRGKLQNLCTTLTKRDILFIFTGNHGINQAKHGADGILLWDFDTDKQWDADEILSPTEFANDTKNCTACRVYSMMVQCYSSKFLAHISDGNHANSAIYAAAGVDECAYSTGTGEDYAQYLAAWDDNDPAQKTMNEMHTHVTNQTLGSTPAKAEGTAGLGDNGLCECCETDCQGKCGDPNNDSVTNVSDAVYIINYVFVGGDEPAPVLACGDANNDGAVNVSDAVSIINYVFVGGNPPGDCMPGSENWYNGNCCPFVP